MRKERQDPSADDGNVTGDERGKRGKGGRRKRQNTDTV